MKRSYIMKEKDLASSIIQKMFWTIIILIVALVGTNLAWIWYINQYDFVTESVEQQAEKHHRHDTCKYGVGGCFCHICPSGSDFGGCFAVGFI